MSGSKVGMSMVVGTMGIAKIGLLVAVSLLVGCIGKETVPPNDRGIPLVQSKGTYYQEVPNGPRGYWDGGEYHSRHFPQGYYGHEFHK